MSSDDSDGQGPEAEVPDERASEPRLRPARPHSSEERPAYLPRIPWKWILLGVVLVGGVVGWWQWTQHQKAEALRSDILRAYDAQVAPMGERYRAFRSKLETWTTQAAQRPPRQHVDARLKISALHRGQGLYLRVPTKAARSADTLAAAARAMELDAIPRCLAIAPISARGIWEMGGVLEPSWRDGARDASGVMRLRVLDDELARRSSRDLPVLANMMRSQWFLLVLQNGENRRDHPVDVFLWDLRRDQQLLAVRVQARGLLVPARIHVEGAPPSPRVEHRQSGGAHDCSIAAQVKELTGEPALTFGSALPTAPPDAGPAVDAGPRDAGPARRPDAGPR